MIRFEMVKEKNPESHDSETRQLARMEKSDFTDIASSMQEAVNYFAIITHTIPHYQAAVQMLQRLERWGELLNNVGCSDKLVVTGYGEKNSSV